MKKILPISEPEPMSSSHQATIFSILKTRKEGISWLVNNYIQLFCLKNMYEARAVRRGTLDYYYNLYGDWSLFEFSANPLLEYNLIGYQILRRYRGNFRLIDFLISMINDEKYLYIGIDKYYIRYYEECGNEHSSHHLFINGYDKQEEIFIAHDNFKGGKYCEHKVSFLEVREAFESVLDNKMLEADAYAGGIITLKPKVRYWHREIKDMFTINVGQIVCYIKEYLMLPVYRERYDYSRDYVFGIECYAELEKLVYWSQENVQEVDHRAFCCMRDHKKIMIFRLKELEKYLGRSLEEYIFSMKIVEENLSLIIMKILKYNFNKKNKILKEIIQTIKWIKEEESSILMKFINEMEETV